MGSDHDQMCFLLDIFLLSYHILAYWAWELVILFIDKISQTPKLTYFWRVNGKQFVSRSNIQERHKLSFLYLIQDRHMNLLKAISCDDLLLGMV